MGKYYHTRTREIMTVYVIVINGYYFGGEREGEVYFSMGAMDAKWFDTLGEAIEANTGYNGTIFSFSMILEEVED